ncbi:tetratricopeptide repeat protein [Allorhizocola rhizosphaerae]|uniref:tetratricopeptide repeat protein n=1 Tax=Allorhizocola rhizosphaerae TaxID=1872709 RepID=UPI000E3DB9F2|nr:tetratricopeptide repeat protein [Allorhizocola rhizosphaerae]
MDERLVRAKDWYERAVFGGEDGAVANGHSELDSVEADLALARGRLVHAQFLADRKPYQPGRFERAVELYSGLGDTRGEAEALFWLGTYHQVVHGDHDTALPHLQRARDLALAVDDKLTLSYVVRHIGFAEMAAGNPDTARELLEQSVALRREVGFQPGVAAGLLSLAFHAHETGDHAAAESLFDEAMATAQAVGARGIINWIESARAELSA